MDASSFDPGRGPIPAGQRLGGYRLAQRIGEGGMGVVHLGVDPSGRAVAVKVLRPHIAGDPEARRRLGREVDSLRRVRHPRVAEVLDADVDGETPYVVTQFVPGMALDEHVRTHGPLDGTALARLGNGLGEALAAIHAAGIVHRDLKPGNVLMLDGDPVVIDFGIAHIADDVRLTSTGLVMGTPGYLSPELVEGDQVTQATDWWGWAATMTFAATGRPPFGRGPMEVVLDRVRRGVADLGGVPAALVPVLSAALAVDPAQRPAPGVLRTAIAQLEDAARGAEQGEAAAAADDVGGGGGADDEGPADADVMPFLRSGGAALAAAAAEVAASNGAHPPRGDAPTQVVAAAVGRGDEQTEVVPARRPEPARVPEPTPQSMVTQNMVAPDMVAPDMGTLDMGTQDMVTQHVAAPPVAAATTRAPVGPPRSVEPVTQVVPVGHEEPGTSAMPAPAATRVMPAVRPAAPPATYPPAPPPHQQTGHLPSHPNPHPNSQPQLHPQPVPGPNPYARRELPPQGPPPQGPPRQPTQPGPYPAAAQRPAATDPGARPRRTGVLVASAVTLAAVTAVVPLIATIAGVAFMVLARTVDRTAGGMHRRRYERGRRPGDGARAVASSPWHLVMAVLVTLPAIVLPLLVGVSVAFIVGLAGPTGPAPGDSIPLAAGAVAALITAWGGPGGGSVRRGSRMVARAVAPGVQTGRLVVALLVIVAAGALAVVATDDDGQPDWSPLEQAPFTADAVPGLP